MSVGLGRGLGALIPTGDVEPTELSNVPGVQLRLVSPADIHPNPRQPRQTFDEEALEELAFSLKEVGFLQPIVVRKVDDGWEIVAGERRWRAAQHAQLESVPVLIRETHDDDLLRDALLENLHRVDLNPLEEASAYQQLLNDFGCTQDVLAKKIGRSRPAIANALRLLKLPAQVQRRVAAGVLSAGHARALAGLDDEDVMEKLASRIVAEGLSVRAVEELIAMGDVPQSTPPRNRRATSGTHSELAIQLADYFDTRVKITGSERRGKISIEYGSPEDLQRIISLLQSPEPPIDA